MKIRTPLVLVSLLSVLFSWLGTAAPARAAAPDGVRLRRYALLVGVNNGGPTRAQLRYAASDAHAVARVLESLGGVAPADLVFVADGSRRALQEGFAAVERMLRADRSPGVRRELVFYYSGHSDEEGLLLGGERISYQELRAFIHDAPADLSLAILDSCESGAFTRHKGGDAPPAVHARHLDRHARPRLPDLQRRQRGGPGVRSDRGLVSSPTTSSPGCAAPPTPTATGASRCRRRFSSPRRRRWRGPSGRRAARSTPPTSSISRARATWW